MPTGRPSIATTAAGSLVVMSRNPITGSRTSSTSSSACAGDDAHRLRRASVPWRIGDERVVAGVRPNRSAERGAVEHAAVERHLRVRGPHPDDERADVGLELVPGDARGGLLVLGELASVPLEQELQRVGRFRVAEQRLLAERDVLKRTRTGLFGVSRLELGERARVVSTLVEPETVLEVPARLGRLRVRSSLRGRGLGGARERGAPSTAAVRSEPSSTARKRIEPVLPGYGSRVLSVSVLPTPALARRRRRFAAPCSMGPGSAERDARRPRAPTRRPAPPWRSRRASERS